ncbi:MAG: response regulator transcription factor [Alphaproteobacteria bacterium]|nr:response regulator transcription factor [Alphaproteobacteria bacterium]
MTRQPVHVLLVGEGTLPGAGRPVGGRDAVLTPVRTRQAMLDAIRRRRFDLILFDLAWFDAGGPALYRELRRLTPAPVILLTDAAFPVESVTGLEPGASDYIATPIPGHELLARARALDGLPSTVASAPPAPPIAFGDWALCATSRRLKTPTGDDVQLTGGEFRLLKRLAENPNRTLSRDQLLGANLVRYWEPPGRTIDVLMGRLRRKIERDPKNPRIIQTIRNVGYVLVDTGAQPRERA